jgi:hypothetical protein
MRAPGPARPGCEGPIFAGPLTTMTPNVNDWFRSVGVVGTAFAAVIAFTLGAALAIVPSGSDPSQGSATPPPADGTPMPTTAAEPTAIGGTLTVTGDREGAFVLERETTQNRYGLIGPAGRILFDGGDPVTVARIQYDGLEFFVAPDDCTVVPGERHDPTGVAGAEIHCASIDDVRDNGTIGVEGRVGVAASLFGLRGDLPESGGTLTFGDETLEIGETWFTVPTDGFFGASIFVGQLVDENAGVSVNFGYDPRTHELSVDEVVSAGERTRLGGECSTEEVEIGLLDPHTRVVELRLRCDPIELPDRGVVSLAGSVIVHMTEPLR